MGQIENESSEQYRPITIAIEQTVIEELIATLRAAYRPKVEFTGDVDRMRALALNEMKHQIWSALDIIKKVPGLRVDPLDGIPLPTGLLERPRARAGIETPG